MTHSTPRSRRRKALTAADLPIRVPLVHGETTMSYLARTATGNGLQLPLLLRALQGERTFRRLPSELNPRDHELRLDDDAARLLGDLVERDEEQLRRALPGLRGPDPLPASGVSVVTWPNGYGIRPLTGCPLCLEADVWLTADGFRWRPCACGRRWQCGDDGGYLIDTTVVPDIGRAFQRHRALIHRLGPAGDALVSDAHQVVLWWWVSRSVAGDVWREREHTLGAPRRVRRGQLAPAVVYPEAVRLAEAMHDWEVHRSGDRPASPTSWVADLAVRFDAPALANGKHTDPLLYWLELHPSFPRTPDGKGTSAERGWSRLPAAHHRPQGSGPFRANSCLRWVYGLPLTSATDICPHCGGRQLTCRWVSAPDCPDNPSPASTRRWHGVE